MDAPNNLDVNESQNSANKPSKIRFEYEEDEDETIEEVATESSSMCEPEEIFKGDDNKTSSDYYFDSYSHFGKLFLLLLISLAKIMKAKLGRQK